jgi:nicotinamidase-related amidase
MTQKALIVIDIQNDYFPTYAGAKWPLFGMEEASAKAARLVEAARRAGDLVVNVRHEFLSADAPFFLPGSHGAAIHEVALPAEGEPVITKNYTNSFRDTNLKETLDAHGIKEVVIVGAMVHNCIDAATRAAFDYGYAVTVIHDAVATLDMEFGGTRVPAAQVHTAWMAELAFGYATLKSADEYIGDHASAIAA